MFTSGLNCLKDGEILKMIFILREHGSCAQMGKMFDTDGRLRI